MPKQVCGTWFDFTNYYVAGIALLRAKVMSSISFKAISVWRGALSLTAF